MNFIKGEAYAWRVVGATQDFFDRVTKLVHGLHGSTAECFVVERLRYLCDVDEEILRIREAWWTSLEQQETAAGIERDQTA